MSSGTPNWPGRSRFPRQPRSQGPGLHRPAHEAAAGWSRRRSVDPLVVQLVVDGLARRRADGRRRRLRAPGSDGLSDAGRRSSSSPTCSRKRAGDAGDDRRTLVEQPVSRVSDRTRPDAAGDRAPRPRRPLRSPSPPARRRPCPAPSSSASRTEHDDRVPDLERARRAGSRSPSRSHIFASVAVSRWPATCPPCRAVAVQAPSSMIVATIFLGFGADEPINALLMNAMKVTAWIQGVSHVRRLRRRAREVLAGVHRGEGGGEGGDQAQDAGEVAAAAEQAEARRRSVWPSWRPCACGCRGRLEVAHAPVVERGAGRAQPIAISSIRPRASWSAAARNRRVGLAEAVVVQNEMVGAAARTGATAASRSAGQERAAVVTQAEGAEQGGDGHCGCGHGLPSRSAAMRVRGRGRCSGTTSPSTSASAPRSAARRERAGWWRSAISSAVGHRPATLRASAALPMNAGDGDERRACEIRRRSSRRTLDVQTVALIIGGSATCTASPPRACAPPQPPRRRSSAYLVSSPGRTTSAKPPQPSFASATSPRAPTRG